jgi:hypothetical protein
MTVSFDICGALGKMRGFLGSRALRSARNDEGFNKRSECLICVR